MTQAVRAPRPTSNYSAYRQAIQVALTQQPHEWTFKSDEGYRQVLEHVTPAQGAAFLLWVIAVQPRLAWPTIIDTANRNDSLGVPVTADYGELGHFSPSNWRYLAHAVKLWQHIDRLGLKEVDVIELGGGYGGLALFAQRFRPGIRSYTIVDLPEAAILQVRVANELGLALNVVNGLDEDALAILAERDDGVPRLFVSIYAFSEFAQDVRDWYAERLLSYCEHGLIVWNFPESFMGDDGRRFGGPVYPFIDAELTVEPDQPDLYGDHQVVRW